MKFLIENKITFPDRLGFLYEKKTFYYFISLLFSQISRNYINIETITNNVRLNDSSILLRNIHSMLKSFLNEMLYSKITVFNIDKERNKKLIVFFYISINFNKIYKPITFNVYEVLYIGEL